MGSNSRHTLSHAETFPVQARPYAKQPERRMPHTSIQPDRRQQSRHQKLPWGVLVHSDRQDNEPNNFSAGSLFSYFPSANNLSSVLFAALARNSIPHQIDLNELVSPHFSHRWHPVADSHHFSAADWLAGIWLLLTRRFRRGAEPCDFCSAAFPVRR